ncbi:hypothetical protein HHK36_011127 [Tetracentron sinense]|uniref:NAC domain-containing protein n=1 Tax=Tetracentron sinense TaxID=13715 RepID=A0A834ZAP4_TETSI|nr:hypothetical protein HHK36_011127 [Tetracentron sinense]
MEGQPNSSIQLPPGFRFHPSDEELIVHYLRNKTTSRPLPASIMAEIDLYNSSTKRKHDCCFTEKALFGEDEWYFFSPRDRKYPNGARPNRAAASGYWKATGTDKPILTSSGLQSIGVKKALVFYKGRPQKGIKTDWIMNEYRLLDTMIQPSRLKGSMRLDDWVLCRVRQKRNMPKNTWEDRVGPSTDPGDYFPKFDQEPPSTICSNSNPNVEVAANYLYNDCPMLAYIFASQDVPHTETITNIGFQGSNNGTNGGSVKDDHFPVAVSSFESLFNLPLKRKLMEGNQFENLLPSSKKLSNQNEDPLLSGKALTNDNKDNTDMNFCRQYQFQGNVVKPNPLNPIIEFHEELNQVAFTERYL